MLLSSAGAPLAYYSDRIWEETDTMPDPGALAALRKKAAGSGIPGFLADPLLGFAERQFARNAEWKEDNRERAEVIVLYVRVADMAGMATARARASRIAFCLAPNAAAAEIGRDLVGQAMRVEVIAADRTSRLLKVSARQ